MTLSLKRGDGCRLVRGAHFRNDLIERQSGRHCLRCRTVVAREHHQTQAACPQSLKRRERAVFQRIAHGDDSRQSPIDAEEHDRLPGSLQPLALHIRSPRRHAHGAHQRSITQGETPAVPNAGYALTGDGFKMHHLNGRYTTRDCAIYKGATQRVLARALKSGRTGEYDLLRELAECEHLTECGPALRQRSGLVEHEGVDAAQRLDRFGIAKQNALLGTAAACDHDGNRSCQPQCARTGDDEHRDCIDERVRQARLGADEPPGTEGGHGDAYYRRHEPGRHLISELLQRRARPLRLTDESHYLRQDAVRSDTLRLNEEHSGLIDRCAHHLVTSALLNRYRLAREHRLVHV